jgi:hypothetical protein
MHLRNFPNAETGSPTVCVSPGPWEIVYSLESVEGFSGNVNYLSIIFNDDPRSN